MTLELYGRRLAALKMKEVIEVKKRADINACIDQLRVEQSRLIDEVSKIDAVIHRSLASIAASQRVTNATEQQSHWYFLDRLEDEKAEKLVSEKTVLSELSQKIKELNSQQLLLNKINELINFTKSDLKRVSVQREDREIQDLFLAGNTRS